MNDAPFAERCFMISARSRSENLVEMSEKEFTAIEAALFTLVRSRQVKSGGTYVENVHNFENCRRISFNESVEVLDEFLDRNRGL